MPTIPEDYPRPKFFYDDRNFAGFFLLLKDFFEYRQKKCRLFRKNTEKKIAVVYYSYLIHECNAILAQLPEYPPEDFEAISKWGNGIEEKIQKQMDITNKFMHDNILEPWERKFYELINEKLITLQWMYNEISQQYDPIESEQEPFMYYD